jgi:hypothetical protein
MWWYRILRFAFIFILISLPICLFYWFVWKYALNVPFQDDLDGVLEVIKKIMDAPNALRKARIFVLQDDEHRVVFNRIVTYLLYVCNGEVNFKYHLFIGCTLILGIFGMISHRFVRAALPIWGLIPVSLFIFQIQYYEGIFWGMIPCQNFAVLFFAFLSIYLVSQNTTVSLIFAFLFSLLGAFSSGNGLVVFLPFLLILVYQLRYRAALVCFVWACTCAWLYFYDLVIPEFRPKLSDNLLKYPLQVLVDFPAFLGQFFDMGVTFKPLIRGLITVPIGVFIIVWFVFLCQKLFLKWQKNTKSDATNQALVCWVGFLMFIMATAAVFSIARAGDGFEAVFRSRYKLNLAIIMALCYTTLFMLVANRWRKTVFMVGLNVALVANVLSYYQNFANIETFRRNLMTDMLSWKHGSNIPTSPIYFSPTVKPLVDSIIVHSLQHHYYTIPETIFTPIERQLTSRPTIEPNLLGPPMALDSTPRGEDYLIFSNSTFVQGNALDDGAYLILKSGNETHFFPAQQRRGGIRHFLKNQQFYSIGFETAPILTKGLKKGTYEVYVVVVSNGNCQIRPTNKKVMVEKSFKES